MSAQKPGVYRFSRPERGYTPIAHQFSRCRELKPRAVKVGLYILSHAEGFVQTQAQIAQAMGMDETTVRAALKDLEALRFMVRHDVRDERGHRTGTAYAVTDVPFTDEEMEQLSPPGKSPAGKNPGGKSPGPKKTTPVRETTPQEEDQPSGGSAVADAPTPEEEPMPRRTSDQPALFEVACTEPRQTGKTAAQSIVAAFVDSHRQAHGTDPGRAEIGRVARDAASLLRTAPVERLLAAATAMGRTPYANLGVQLKIVNRTSPDKGRAPAHPHGASEWSQGAQAVQATAQAVLETSPDLAAWMAGQAATA